jgi:hypothetical protein
VSRGIFYFSWLRLKAHGFTCADAHIDVTRAAKRAACDGDGNAKQSHKGKGKGKVGGFQISPLSIMQSACNSSNLASCFAVIAPPQ